MKKISAITFHRAQNFGSALQTYALKETVLKLAEEAKNEVSYSVIDISNTAQKDLYRHYKRIHSINDIIKNASNAIENSASMSIDMFSSFIYVIAMYFIFIVLAVSYKIIYFVLTPPPVGHLP